MNGPPEREHASRGIFARVVANAGRLLAGKALAGVLSFAAITLAARGLGVAGFGALLLIHTTAVAFSAFTRLQSWQPLLHFGSSLFENGESRPFQALLRRCLMLDAAGAFTGLALALPLAFLFGPSLGWPAAERGAAALYMTSILFMNTCCAMGTLRLTNRFGQAALGDVAASWCRALGALAGFALHWGFGAWLAVWYAATVASFATDHVLAWRALRHAPALRGFRLRTRERTAPFPGLRSGVLATSAEFWLSGMDERIVLLLTGALLGPAAAAVFSVTRDVCEALGHPADLLAPALYPELIRLREKRDWAQTRRVVRRLLASLGAFCALALAVCALFGPSVVRWALGANQAASLPLLLFLAATALIDLWDTPLEPLLLSFGRAGLLAKGRALGAALRIALICTLAPRWQLAGVGLACLVAESVILATRLRAAFRLSRAQTGTDAETGGRGRDFCAPR